MSTNGPAGQFRVVLLAAGVACIVVGAALGWFAARQNGGGAPGGVAMRASDVAAAAATAHQAAVASEGWAHVANGASTLAKSDVAAAEAIRRQAQAFAARAEKAAAAANAAAAKASQDRRAIEAARASVPAAAPIAAARVSSPAAAPVAKPVVKRRAIALAKPVASAFDEGCSRAIIFERTAADRSIAHRAAYNAAMSGFAMNAHCAGPQHTLNEAYLLAQRAAAEGALHVGDWQADLSRSDQLLAQCAKLPEFRGRASAGCLKRLRKNQRIRQTLQGRPPHA